MGEREGINDLLFFKTAPRSFPFLKKNASTVCPHCYLSFEFRMTVDP